MLHMQSRHRPQPAGAKSCSSSPSLLLFYVGAEAAFGGWIYTYAVALDLSGATTAAYLTSAFWGALTFGRLVGIPIAARFRPRTILLVDLLGCLASVGVILVWTSSPVAVWLGALGLGFSMASIFPTAISLAERRIPITGAVTGWFLVASSIGAMSVPWLIGQLFEPVGAADCHDHHPGRPGRGLDRLCRPDEGGHRSCGSV